MAIRNRNHGVDKVLTTLLSLFFLVLPGCKTTHAPMRNTIISRVESPDHKMSAILVQRDYKVALSNDQFYLLILNNGQDVRSVISNNDIANSSALIATLAAEVQLRWQDDGTLLVFCDSCGVQAIDISKKLDHIGSIKIVYQGFPEHTAYS